MIYVVAIQDITWETEPYLEFIGYQVTGETWWNNCDTSYEFKIIALQEGL